MSRKLRRDKKTEQRYRTLNVICLQLGGLGFLLQHIRPEVTIDERDIFGVGSLVADLAHRLDQEIARSRLLNSPKK